MIVTDLLLLHGALGASGQLEPLASVMTASARVHRLDFEGHGSEPARDRPFRASHFVENVIAYLDRSGIERVNVFGYSMGGYVALCLAGSRPGRVAGIATLGTKFRWDHATAAREASRLNPEKIREKVPRFAEALEARHQSAGGWESVLARTAEFLEDLGANPPLTDEVLAQVPQPVLVMVGDRDATVSVDESRGVVRSLPAGRLTVLPDTPHPIEQVPPARILPYLRDFFAAPSEG